MTGSLPTLRYYFRMCREGLRKTTNKIHESRYMKLVPKNMKQGCQPFDRHIRSFCLEEMRKTNISFLGDTVSWLTQDYRPICRDFRCLEKILSFLKLYTLCLSAHMSLPCKQNTELFSFSYQNQMMGPINSGVSVGITVSILAKKKGT
jgi:hypothetical protein